MSKNRHSRGIYFSTMSIKVEVKDFPGLSRALAEVLTGVEKEGHPYHNIWLKDMNDLTEMKKKEEARERLDREKKAKEAKARSTFTDQVLEHFSSQDLIECNQERRCVICREKAGKYLNDFYLSSGLNLRVCCGNEDGGCYEKLAQLIDNPDFLPSRGQCHCSSWC